VRTWENRELQADTQQISQHEHPGNGHEQEQAEKTWMFCRTVWQVVHGFIARED
jgi:hypothetical protein